MLTAIAMRASNHKIGGVIRTAPRQWYYMIYMVLVKFLLTPIALAFLSLILSLDIFCRKGTYRLFLTGSTKRMLFFVNLRMCSTMGFQVFRMGYGPCTILLTDALLMFLIIVAVIELFMFLSKRNSLMRLFQNAFLAVRLQAILPCLCSIEKLSSSGIQVLTFRIRAPFMAFWYGFITGISSTVLSRGAIACLTYCAISISFSTVTKEIYEGLYLLAFTALLLRGIRGYTVHTSELNFHSSRSRMFPASREHHFVICSNYSIA